MTSPAFMHGALTSMVFALMVLVGQSWPSNDDALVGFQDMRCCCDAELRDIVIESACRDDYAPAPPSDGSWCGVHLDVGIPCGTTPFRQSK